jgi:hypothetical protein
MKSQYEKLLESLRGAESVARGIVDSSGGRGREIYRRLRQSVRETEARLRAYPADRAPVVENERITFEPAPRRRRSTIVS